MNVLENLKTSGDPFADDLADAGGNKQTVGGEGHIHIRLQQRNGRKTLTTVQGISSDYDLNKLVKAWKKEFACNGTVQKHPEYGEVTQLTGDQRSKIKDFLVKSMNFNASSITVHGF